MNIAKGLVFLVQHLTTILKAGFYERQNRTNIPRSLGANANTWFGNQEHQEELLMKLAADMLGLDTHAEVCQTPVLLATNIARLARKNAARNCRIELDSEGNVYMLGDSHPFDANETHALETWARDVLNIYKRVQHGCIVMPGGVVSSEGKQKLCSWDNNLTCKSLFEFMRRLEQQVMQELGVDPAQKYADTQVIFQKRHWGDKAQQNEWKWEALKDCRAAVRNIINGTLLFESHIPADVLVETLEYDDDGVHGFLRTSRPARQVLTA